MQGFWNTYQWPTKDHFRLFKVAYWVGGACNRVIQETQYSPSEMELDYSLLFFSSITLTQAKVYDLKVSL